jgi:hypothetical protein
MAAWAIHECPLIQRAVGLLNQSLGWDGKWDCSFLRHPCLPQTLYEPRAIFSAHK